MLPEIVAFLFRRQKEQDEIFIVAKRNLILQIKKIINSISTAHHVIVLLLPEPSFSVVYSAPSWHLYNTHLRKYD